MNKHTPGPWMHEPSTQARYSWIILTADFNEDANRGTVLCRTSDGISEADARLIAAAPELLEACRTLAALIDVQDHDVASVTIKVRDLVPIVRTARAAIARAEGGAA